MTHGQRWRGQGESWQHGDEGCVGIALNLPGEVLVRRLIWNEVHRSSCGNDLQAAHLDHQVITGAETHIDHFVLLAVGHRNGEFGVISEILGSLVRLLRCFKCGGSARYGRVGLVSISPSRGWHRHRLGCHGWHAGDRVNLANHTGWGRHIALGAHRGAHGCGQDECSADQTGNERSAHEVS